jgi:hypothetical protein
MAQVVDKSFSAYYAAEEHGEDESNNMEVDEGALHWLALAEDTNRYYESNDIRV